MAEGRTITLDEAKELQALFGYPVDGSKNYSFDRIHPFYGLCQYMKSINRYLPDQLVHNPEFRKRFMLAGMIRHWRACRYSSRDFAIENERDPRDELDTRLIAFREYTGINMANIRHYFSLLGLGSEAKMLFVFIVIGLPRYLAWFVWASVVRVRNRASRP